MSNTQRKARKKAGIQFKRTPKVGTPLDERAVPVVQKTIRNIPTTGQSNRAAKKISDRIAFIAKHAAESLPVAAKKTTRKKASA